MSFTWVYPADLWWHLRLGEGVLNGSGVAPLDTYTLTAEGLPFRYQAWLAGVALALLHRLGGVPLIAFLNALAFTAAYALLLQVCSWLSDGRLRIAAAGALGAFLLGIENWAARPQTFSVLGLAGTLWVLWRYWTGRGSPRSLVLLPLITGLWANLHGAFPLGLLAQAAFLSALLAPVAARRLLLAAPAGFGAGGATLPEPVEGRGAGVPSARAANGMLYAAPRRAPSTLGVARLEQAGGGASGAPPAGPLALALVASALATLATPHGPALYEYLAAILSNPAIKQNILEWAAPTIATGPGRALLASAIVLSLLALLGARPSRPISHGKVGELAAGTSRGLGRSTSAKRYHPVLLHRAVPLPGLLLLILTGWLALGALRNVLWFGFAAAPVAAFLAGALSPQAPSPPVASPQPRAAPAGFAVAVFLLALSAVALPWLRPALPLPPDRASLLSPDTPAALAGALAEERGPRRVFADMQYAALLEWRLGDGVRVFTDPRIELFPSGVWADYGTISSGLAPELLDRYQVDALLLHRERQYGLLEWARRRPEWKLFREDGSASLWLHSGDR